MHVTSVSGKQPAELYEPEAYILSLGGKRIRPVLALAGCDLFGGDPRAALDAALAVELFHNFSLIHDDILDAAPLRRGKPTVHQRWNTNIAILSGDVMLVKATQVMESYPPALLLNLLKIFNRTAIEVCEGQQMDMNFEKMQDVSVEAYLDMISKKTAVLLGCSLSMGAMCAGAAEGAQSDIYDFGKHLGIAFQLLDDMLDAYAGDQDKFGKQVGGDIIANKKTFLTLKALELSDEAGRKKIQEICAMQDEKSKVAAMLQVYDRHGVRELCIREADRHTEVAVAALEHIQAPEEKKQMLRDFAKELLNRQI